MNGALDKHKTVNTGVTAPGSRKHSAGVERPRERDGVGTVAKCSRRLGRRPGTAPTPGGEAVMGAAGVEAGLRTPPRPAQPGEEQSRGTGHQL